MSLIRCTSPVHIHVDEETPVHVHVKKPAVKVSTGTLAVTILILMQPKQCQDIVYNDLLNTIISRYQIHHCILVFAVVVGHRQDSQIFR